MQILKSNFTAVCPFSALVNNRPKKKPLGLTNLTGTSARPIHSRLQVD